MAFTRPHHFLPVVSSLAVSSTPVSLGVEDVPAGASAAVVSTSTAIRFAYGVNPTSTVGIEIPTGGVFIIEDCDDFTQLRFIREGSDSVVSFQWASGIAAKKL